jgi:hypothetical protein
MAEWNVEIRASAVPRIVSPSSAVAGWKQRLTAADNAFCSDWLPDDAV